MSIEPTRQRQNELDCSSDDMQTAEPHYHSALPVFIKTLAPCGTMESRHGLVVRSPSSPSSFATQLEMNKVCYLHTNRPLAVAFIDCSNSLPSFQR